MSGRRRTGACVCCVPCGTPATIAARDVRGVPVAGARHETLIAREVRDTARVVLHVGLDRRDGIREHRDSQCRTVRCVCYRAHTQCTAIRKRLPVSGS